jgi:hypothetical protein
MLRRKQPKTEPTPPEAALCMHTFRPSAVAAEIQRGERLPVDHWAVKAHPTYFVGIVPLVHEEVNDGK